MKAHLFFLSAVVLSGVAVISGTEHLGPAVAQTLGGEQAAADGDRDGRYLGYVRQCLDVLIECGTDRYGAAHSPLLMNILDVRTRECPADPEAFDEAYRVTRRERRGPGGGNLWMDQETIRAMYALSRQTGDLRYAQFADRSLSHVMTQMVDEKGLFWWGWHRHYDAHRDEMTGHAGNWHEIHVQRGAWPELWAVDARAVTRQIEALWEWHVIDKATGEVNRHDDGRRGCDFAMSAGEILRAFALLHHQTHQPQWLQRARLLADYYWQRRHPETNLIPNRPNAGPTRFDGSHFDTSIAGLYCRCLLDAFQWTGDPVFRDQAVAYLKAYAKHGYDPATGKFWGSLRLDGTPVPGPRLRDGYAQYEPRGHIDLWQPYVAGYEHPLDAAITCVLAAQMTGDDSLIEASERWAKFIERGLPAGPCQNDTWYDAFAREQAQQGAYADHYGKAIQFFLGRYNLSGQEHYRKLARSVADDAIRKLFHNGLFRGHPAKPYYESIDGVGTLLMALLELESTVAVGANQSDAPWQIGLASVCITPEQPVWLHGYASQSRFRPFDGKLDDLSARAMAIEDADGELAVLIAADLCVLREPEETELSELLMRRTGLARRQILLNWSHTHSGPIIGTSDVNRYPMSEEDLQRTKAYTQWLWNRLADVAEAALADRSPAWLSWGAGRVDFVKNRRALHPDGRYRGMAPNADGPVDQSVPVLRIDGPGRELRGVVFGAACHPVTLGGDSLLVSADFPGPARQYVEEQYPGVLTLFVQGCGADANPDPRATADQVEWVRRHGQALGAEVCRVLSDALQPVTGPLQVGFTRVDLPLAAVPSEERLEELAKGPFWQSHNARRILDAQRRGQPLARHYPAPLALWQFGDSLTLVAISGEVVADYVPLATEAIGTQPVWVAGYSNQVYGYLPSARIIEQGGYETLGLVSAHVGWFAAEAEDTMREAIRALTRETSRRP
jgi:neutral ceramidase